MMDLVTGTASYVPIWPVTVGFTALVAVAALFVWAAYRTEVKAEAKYAEDAYSRYSKYRRIDGSDYGMFAFVSVMLTFLAIIPAAAVSTSAWYHDDSTEAALVREAERVYDVELTVDQAHELLLEQVIEVDDAYLKYGDGTLLQVDGFSELDSPVSSE